jgi:hypothetical protein
MWPFKKDEYTVPELTAIKFGNNEYCPTKDITAQEVALLLPVFGSIGFFVDRESYVKKHNLERHFKKVNSDETIY